MQEYDKSAKLMMESDDYIGTGGAPLRTTFQSVPKRENQRYSVQQLQVQCIQKMRSPKRVASQPGIEEELSERTQRMIAKHKKESLAAVWDVSKRGSMMSLGNVIKKGAKMSR